MKKASRPAAGRQRPLSFPRSLNWLTLFWLGVLSAMASAAYAEDTADALATAAIGPVDSSPGYPVAAASPGLLAARARLLDIGFVTAPPGAYDRPPALYVLPVFLVPADRGEMAPDPANPELNLAGGDFFAGCDNRIGECAAEKYERARNNFAVHLQMARRKYETMLRNPLNGATRGTFRLASWYHDSTSARAIHQYGQDITPLIVYSKWTQNTIIGMYESEDYGFVSEVLEAAGCKQNSCPYIFVVTFPGVQVAGGRKFNYGYNNGGGVAFLDFNQVRESDDPEVNFQSTLIHELGHAFGMPHIFDYCIFHPADPFDCEFPWHMSWSESIMGYNPDNWIFGCPATKPPPLEHHCRFPDDITVIDAFPGILMANDKRVLGKNDLAIPGFEFDEELDVDEAIEGESDRLSGQGDTDTGLPRFRISSSRTDPAGQTAGALIGGYSEDFPEFYQPVDGTRMWGSDRDAADLEWLPFDLRVPEPAALLRIRFYSGCTTADPVCATASGVRAGLADGSTVSVLTGDLGANVDLNLPPVAATRYAMAVRTGTGGRVSLRGLRFFAMVNGVEQEFFPPDEPVATTGFGNAFGGSLANITGSDQVVSPLADPFNPATAWHSDTVSPGDFVSLDVEFPRSVSLGYIKVHTGHTSIFHIADQIQIERRCLCDGTLSGAGGACGRASALQCGVAGTGNFVSEFVKRVNSGPDELIDFPAATSSRWKIALRTQNAGDQAWMVVRGFRFFSPEGLEMFPAKQVPD